MDNRQDRFLFFLLLSLILHILFFGFTFFHLPIPHESTAGELEVTLQPYKIADILPPEKEERPEKAKYLGLYDSRVPEEKVAASLSPGGSQGARKRKEGEGNELAAKTPASGLPGALPEDFYPDYKIADHTYLNVLRFPQVAYFVRLKKVFKTTFNPVPAIRGYAMTNQISRGQIEVVLGVTVDRSGNLAELFVLNTSGLETYDREAIRTIRDSSPFTAPPPELLSPDGRLRMSWTFTVYL